MENQYYRPRIAISEADLELGVAAVRALRDAGISDPMEICLISGDQQRVQDCITSSAFVGVAAYLFAQGMPAERASDITSEVADGFMDLWWARQHGKPKPN